MLALGGPTFKKTTKNLILNFFRCSHSSGHVVVPHASQWKVLEGEQAHGDVLLIQKGLIKITQQPFVSYNGQSVKRFDVWKIDARPSPRIKLQYLRNRHCMCPWTKLRNFCKCLLNKSVHPQNLIYLCVSSIIEKLYLINCI